MKSQPLKSSAFADTTKWTLSAKADDFSGCDFISLLSKTATAKRVLI